MEQNLNDKTACLVTAFQSGDVSAFSTLYDMHINLLFNYGCKLTTDKELLKDCIHDVFVKLYTKKAELGIIDNFKSYLLISLKNKLCDELRRRMFMSETAVEELNPVAAGDDVVFAGLNGVSFYFMRGTVCEMPAAVVEILKNCGEM